MVMIGELLRGSTTRENLRHTPDEYTAQPLSMLKSSRSTHKEYADERYFEHVASLITLVGERSDATPDVTVCVPLLLPEDADKITHLLGAINGSIEDDDTVTEVLVWCNAPSPISAVQALTISESYEHVREALEHMPTPNVYVRTALDVARDGRYSMTEIRSRYMDALCQEAQNTDPEMNRAIVWLDADTTFIANNTIRDLTSVLARGDYHFTHTEYEYDLEWLRGKKKADYDDASKLLLIDEMANRATRKAERSMGAQKVPYYPEESGLGFRLRDYCEAGGLDLDNPVDEAPTLIERWAKNSGESLGVNEKIKYIDARIRVSARRVHRDITQGTNPARALRDRALAQGGDYSTYSQRPTANNDWRVSDDAVSALERTRSDSVYANNAGNFVVKRMMKNLGYIEPKDKS